MRVGRNNQHARVAALVASVALVSLVLMPSRGSAQYTPFEGAHYATMAGTGFQSAVNATGAYAASVPLDLPAARGGVVVPVQVAYNGREVGAAGLGWDVPLSFIALADTTAKRRPAPQAFSLEDPAELKAPTRLALTLLGDRIDLVRNDSDTAWVARRGNAQIEVRSTGDGLMAAYDGAGRTYNFSSRGASAGSRLAEGKLFLLTSIVDANANTVQLGYSIGAPLLPGGSSGLAINLSNVSYNQHPGTAGCFKHKISLVYDTGTPSAAPPLAMAMLNGTVLARTQKVTAIVVQARETCSSQPKTLATYSLAYAADPDTRLPQLQSVTMTGQHGTPEQNVVLPVASYGYGSIVDKATNRITFQQVASAGPPELAQNSHYEHGLSFTDNRRTEQLIVDLNGDGRDDFLSHSGIPRASSTYYGIAGPNGQISFSAPVTGDARAPSFRAVVNGGGPNESLPDRQLIDLNGDGRLDYLMADEDAEANRDWMVDLNTPDPANPGETSWVRRTISTDTIRRMLSSRIGDNDWMGYPRRIVPLTRHVTTTRAPYATCWTAHQGQWIHHQANPEDFCPDFPRFNTSRRKTVTDFELRDVNGDGYPDFVYTASRVQDSGDSLRMPPDEPASPDGQHRIVVTPLDIAGSRDVMVLINTAGAHIENGVELFSSPVLLESGGEDGCGVERWQPDEDDEGGGLQNQVCGFSDVNGDGIADRVTTPSGGSPLARLGTGDMRRPYANATITLPGPLGRVETLLAADPDTDPDLPKVYRPATCPLGAGPSATYLTSTTRLLRDLNGDRIADYLRAPATGAANEWFVSMGTGTGFAPEVAIGTGNLSALGWLSLNRSACQRPSDVEEVAAAVAGLYELDGDGQPEIVSFNRDASTWDIWQLKPPIAQVDVGTRIASVPAAGRLTRIDHPYGASTTIGYRSAKEEWNPEHAVPFPEIVVESVGTRNAVGASLLTTKRYAYRGAEMVFDPAYDGFRFPGYRRSVVLDALDDGSGTATITDALALQPFIGDMDPDERFSRYMRVGLPATVTTLSGSVGNNPWDLLNADIETDQRRSAGVHHTWATRRRPSGPVPEGSEACRDMKYPLYDFDGSADEAPEPDEDACLHNGFAYESDTFTWRGRPGSGDAITSTHVVQTSRSILSIDDSARVIDSRDDNDLVPGEQDDICTHTTYAARSPGGARILGAPWTRTTTDCGSKLLASHTFEYDGLEPGLVSRGMLTSRSSGRFDLASGQPIDSLRPEVRAFEATYDASGNLATISTAREDGATKTTTLAYEPFGLVPVSARITASGTGSLPPSLLTTSVVDPVTLNVLGVIDANGTRRGRSFDGFGREILETITPPGGSEGVLARTSYLGFARGESGDKRVVRKTFTDPVPRAGVESATGRTATVFVDVLGRARLAQLALGPSYGNKTLAMWTREHDQRGRVRFEADPFVVGEGSPAAYGTTHHYNPDGTPQCTLRGFGYQPFVANLDSEALRSREQIERYVSCESRSYANRRELVVSTDAAQRLPGSPQWNGFGRSTFSAIGRLLMRESIVPFETEQAERIAFDYDAAGNRTKMTRWLDPQHGTGEVATSWTYDSLHQVTGLLEPGAAPQTRRYDEWGALAAVQWCDASVGSCDESSPNRGSFFRYDAYGRLTHSEDREDGVAIPETLREFAYDLPVVNAVPPVDPAHVLGRLSKATAPTSSVAFGYDTQGRVEAEVHTDRTDPSLPVFVQRYDHHGDGSIRRVHAQLPDTEFADEVADYAYDSAGRLRSVRYSDGTQSRDLFVADGQHAIDAFGRIRDAKFGANTFTGSYAAEGRRLLSALEVASPAPLATTREILFAGTNGALPSHDPLGRERTRQEVRDGGVDAPIVESSYDELGRLSGFARRTQAAGLLSSWAMYYDPLGNLIEQRDMQSTSTGAAISYQAIDPDRVCSIAYAGAPPATCNVAHDAVGNVVRMPTREGDERVISYYPSGATRKVTVGPSGSACPSPAACTTATFDHDAFGIVQRVVVDSAEAADTRRDKHFGPLIQLRNERVDGASVAVINRSFPGPEGFVATRHGASADAPWTFVFGEPRGTRFVTDGSGAFVQDLDYQPYGELASAGGELPGSVLYTNRQWNDGDALSAIGLSQLGARLYDPATGRFLSRDPLIVPRTGATTNAYAFAMNDPVNRGDPTGLDPIGGIEDCYICAPPPGFPGLPGGGGDRDPAHDVPTRPTPPPRTDHIPCYSCGGDQPAPADVPTSRPGSDPAPSANLPRRAEGAPAPSFGPPHRSILGPPFAEPVESREVAWYDLPIETPDVPIPMMRAHTEYSFRPKVARAAAHRVAEAAAVVEYAAHHGVISPYAGVAAEIAGNTAEGYLAIDAGVQLAVDPTSKTISKFVGVFVDRALLKGGPVGWGVYALKTAAARDAPRVNAHMRARFGEPKLDPRSYCATHSCTFDRMR